MNLIVTGTPGSGKTTLAKSLAKALKMHYLNEKDFALKHKLGSFNEDNELEIPLKKFAEQANKELSKKNNMVLEGHLLCEMKLKVNYAILLTIDPEILELRLEKRKYPMEKVMDNVFCEGIEYCKKHLNRNYPKKKIIEIRSQSTPQKTLAIALGKLKQMK